jgi:hypothetical protein
MAPQIRSVVATEICSKANPFVTYSVEAGDIVRPIHAERGTATPNYLVFLGLLLSGLSLSSAGRDPQP